MKKTTKAPKLETIQEIPEPPAPTKVQAPPLSDEDFDKQLSESLKKAAIDGAREIQLMITDKEVSDASRLAAAKWAIERVAKEQGSDSPNASLNMIMEMVRELRAASQSAKAPAPVLPGEISTEAAEPEKNWNNWLAENFKH